MATVWIFIKPYMHKITTLVRTQTLPFYFLWGLLLVLAFFIRIYHLNYNTPFIDEAIYVVIGKLGVFENDWSSYNAQSWMAGLPYVYPPLSALAYVQGGIVASRLLNVVFGLLVIEEVFRFTYLLNLSTKGRQLLAGSIAAFITAFSAISLHLSRLATYDILSILFMLISLNCLIKSRYYSTGKFFLISAAALLLAFTTKIIIGAYIPLIIAASFYFFHRTKSRTFTLYQQYFLVPLFFGLLLYLATNSQNLLSFFDTQVIGREFYSFSDLLDEIVRFMGIVIAVSVPSSFLLIIKGKARSVLFLLVFAFWVPLMHLVNHRMATLDKHLMFTLVFLSPLIASALTYWLSSPVSWYRRAFAAFCLVAVPVFFFSERPLLANLENQWQNTASVETILYQNARPDYNILTSNGAPTILALYDRVAPANVSTFDWFVYGGLEGDAAYRQAVTDGYFDLIELEIDHDRKPELVDDLINLAADHYQVVYRQHPFVAYERIY